MYTQARMLKGKQMLRNASFAPSVFGGLALLARANELPVCVSWRFHNVISSVPGADVRVEHEVFPARFHFASQIQTLDRGPVAKVSKRKRAARAGTRENGPSSAGLEPCNVSFASYLFFCVSVLFSQHRNASLDVTQASASCSASAESNLAPESNCQADKTFLLGFTLKRCSFSRTEHTPGSQIADMCERGRETPAFFHAPRCKNSAVFI